MGRFSFTLMPNSLVTLGIAAGSGTKRDRSIAGRDDVSRGYGEFPFVCSG